MSPSPASALRPECLSPSWPADDSPLPPPDPCLSGWDPDVEAVSCSHASQLTHYPDCGRQPRRAAISCRGILLLLALGPRQNRCNPRWKACLGRVPENLLHNLTKSHARQALGGTGSAASPGNQGQAPAGESDHPHAEARDKRDFSRAEDRRVKQCQERLPHVARIRIPANL